MITRFWFESIVGLVCIIGILLFGKAGFVCFALFALLPVVTRLSKSNKPDERELQLFYKTGNLSLALTIIVIYLISRLSDIVVNGPRIGDNWMLFSVTSIIMFHGIAGLIVFHRN